MRETGEWKYHFSVGPNLPRLSGRKLSVDITCLKARVTEV